MTPSPNEVGPRRMSPEAQRSAMALALGWTLRPSGSGTMWYHPDGCPIGYGPDAIRTTGVGYPPSRPRNQEEPMNIELSTVALKLLNDVHRTGLFGGSPEETARRLVEERLRQLVADGTVQPATNKKDL